MPPKIWIPNQSVSLEKHLTKSVRSKEVITLYRDILKTVKHFHWSDKNNTGKPWNLILKENAKKEFHDSKSETDPLIIARMIITARDCLQQIQLKFNDATIAAWKRIETDNTYNSSSPSSTPTPTQNNHMNNINIYKTNQYHNNTNLNNNIINNNNKEPFKK